MIKNPRDTSVACCCESRMLWYCVHALLVRSAQNPPAFVARKLVASDCFP